MEWYNIVVLIVGAFGGVTGFISLYNAKSNKDTIDISNFHSLIEEERTERKELIKEYHEYRAAVEHKVDSVKKEFEELKRENQKMLKSIYQGYRCKLPQKLLDCPVIRMFTEGCSCEDCNNEDEHIKEKGCE